MSKLLPRASHFSVEHAPMAPTDNGFNLQGIFGAAAFKTNTPDFSIIVDQQAPDVSFAISFPDGLASGNAGPDTGTISVDHPSSSADFSAPANLSSPLSNVGSETPSVTALTDSLSVNAGMNRNGWSNNFEQEPSVAPQNHLSFVASSNQSNDAGNESDAFLIFSEAGHGPGGHGPTSSTSGGTSNTISTATTGLIINVTYDSSVNNAPAGFKTVIEQVVQYFESHFTDPVTINITVGYGEVNNHSLGPGALGASVTYLNSVTYSDLKNALALDAKDSADSSAVASLPASNPNSGNFWLSTAEAKALGLMGASTSVDGYVGFSSSSGIFDYNNSDGVSPGTYDFFGVVAHEFSEVLGRILLVGATIGSTANSYDALDLFHYSSPGVHDYSGSIPGYFSIDGGQTSLNTFNTVSGGDPGDWAGATIDAYNAFANSGALLPISNADLLAMDVIGWDSVSSSPPPALPDLTVSNLAVGGTNINFTINNIGTASTGASSTTGIYLSTDGTITTSDAPLATISTPDLPAGQQTWEGVPLSLLSAQATAGTYYLGVIADSGQLISESNETNNTAALPVLLGTNGSDLLNGTTAKDCILGFDGNDTITGGAGADTLSGGAGSDHFVYRAKTDGLDQILDFTPGSDVLDFAASAFGRHLATGGANTGTLDPSHFLSGSSEGNFAGRGAGFWFNTDTHILYYDSNGNSAGGLIAMAQLEAGVTITNSSIHLV